MSRAGSQDQFTPLCATSWLKAQGRGKNNLRVSTTKTALTQLGTWVPRGAEDWCEDIQAGSMCAWVLFPWCASSDLIRSSIFQQQSKERRHFSPANFIQVHSITQAGGEGSNHSTQEQFHFLGHASSWCTQRQHICDIHASLCPHRAGKQDVL